MTISDICNQALDLIGEKRRIGSLYEGSMPARMALDLWLQTRDELLMSLKPEWAYKDAVLVPITTAPNIAGSTAEYPGTWATTYPPIGFLYEYQWPDDCVWPIQIKTTPSLLPTFRPRYSRFRMASNVTFGRSILTDEYPAILAYIFQAGDVRFWTPDFTEAMIQILAKKFQVGLAPEEMKQQRGRQQQQQETAGGNTNQSR